ncbi:MAG: response regulator, partial [Fibrobacteria bacterium]|nr:response regulator [Fibrobacteria bacterium]
MTGGKKQILWVDDEIEFLRAHIMFLEEHNYDVTKATNGDDAIELIKENHFDLIFLDEQMPGKDGLTTLEELKVFEPNIPVVMVTKSEEEQLMEEAFGHNINSYLTKPVNPSQILSVCKRILHVNTIKKTVITSSYVTEYAEYKAKFMTRQSIPDWHDRYQVLCKWDINLQTLKDQGLLETHNNHKAEASHKFIKYIEENYISWHSGREPNNFLITQSLSNHLFPLLQENKKTCLVVMTGLRMDQWLTMKPALEPFFNLVEKNACALLPTNRLYCRSALLAGETALRISQDHPQLWEHMNKGEDPEVYEQELLKLNLFKHGIRDIDNPVIKYIRAKSDSDRFLSDIETYDDEKLVVLVVDFPEMLMRLREESTLIMEMAPDEQGLREITKIWFKSSNLLKILQRFALADRSVVFTSDHGSVLVKRPVEVFCQEEKTPNPRVKIGQDISCDERHVFFIESPAIFGLPSTGQGVGYAIAKEDFYFTYPNKYQYFGTRFKGQMVNG